MGAVVSTQEYMGKAKATRVQRQLPIIKILNTIVKNVTKSLKDFRLNYVIQGTTKDNMKKHFIFVKYVVNLNPQNQIYGSTNMKSTWPKSSNVNFVIVRFTIWKN